MRIYLLVIGMILSFPALVVAQEVKVKEETVQFSVGSQRAILTEIPFADREQVAKQLKSELKGWGGKLSISGDEYKVTQGKMKAFGDKPFDGYAKIIQTGDDVQVAFAVDLGGTFMTSGAHPSEHRVISERAHKFGSKTASLGIKAHVAADKKALKLMEKEEKQIEKSIESSTKDIEDYQKKIKQAQKDIETKKGELSAKQEAIKNQNLQLTDRKNKAKNLK